MSSDEPKEETYVQKLEERLRALERQQQEDRILRLRAMQARSFPIAGEPAVEVTDPADPGDAPLSPDEFTAVARTTYTSQLTSEGVDATWSSKREAEITVALQERNIPGIDLNKVTCGKTLCELSFEQKPEFDPSDMHKLLVTIHPNGSFYSEKDPSTGQLVVFVARSGELPAPTSQDG